MTIPIPTILRVTPIWLLAVGGMVVATSNAEPVPVGPDTASEDSLTPNQQANIQMLEEQVAATEARRDLALAKVKVLQEKLKTQEAANAALTADLARKEQEVAKSGAGPAGRAVSTEPKAKLPAKFVADVTPRVVIIEGDGGSGTGFLCASDGELWVYTAAHVLSNNRRISVRDSKGRVYREFEYLECAEGVDLVRLKPKDPDFQGLELVSPTEAPKVGDVVVAVGNSLGTGSLSGEPGRVRKIEKDLWEVDAEIIPGNSGGPVLSLDTGKVVGIVTHLIIHRADGQEVRSREPEVKRFAARLDKKWEWRRMPVTRFVKEWEHVGKMHRDSSIAWAAIYLMHTGPGGSTDPKLRSIAESIIAEEREHIQVMRVDQWLKSYREAGKLQQQEMINDGNNIISRILEEIQLKGAEPEACDFSWFHRQSYEAELKWRKKLSPPAK